jgi:hypothetical protein
MLSVTAMTWQHGFRSFKLDFGPDNREYVVGKHDHLRRRGLGSLVSGLFPDGGAAATTAQTIVSAIVSSDISVTPTTSLRLPSIASTVRPTITSIVNDVGHQLLDTQILPEAGNSALADAEGFVVPAGLTVTCVNCTLTGEIEMFSGSLSVSDNRIIAFVESGYVEVITHGLSAHIELETSWLAEGTGKTYTINLVAIPLQPFSIPDVAVVGPMFQPHVLIDVHVLEDIDFEFGFEAKVPDGSSAIVNFGNVTNSTIQGFQNTMFSMLPFNSNTSNVAVNLNVTLSPEILIGVSFPTIKDTIGAGIFLNLPQLALSVEQVSSTNLKCESITNSTLANDILKLLGNLTHVVSNIELAGVSSSL